MKKDRAHYARRRAMREAAPDPHVLRSCPVHKISYDTERLAKQAATGTRAHSGAVLYPYKCPFCRFWHLTKQAR